MGIRMAFGSATAVAVMLAGCVPDVTPSPTDQFTIDAYQRWSEPAYDVSGEVVRSCVTPEPFENVELFITVTDPVGSQVEQFSMRRGEYVGYQLADLPLPAPGTYGYDSGVNGLYTGFSESALGNAFGSSGGLDIEEITLERTNTGCLENYDVTRLRATFWISTTHGIVTGSVQIG